MRIVTGAKSSAGSIAIIKLQLHDLSMASWFAVRLNVIPRWRRCGGGRHRMRDTQRANQPHRVGVSRSENGSDHNKDSRSVDPNPVQPVNLQQIYCSRLIDHNMLWGIHCLQRMRLVSISDTCFLHSITLTLVIVNTHTFISDTDKYCICYVLIFVQSSFRERHRTSEWDMFVDVNKRPNSKTCASLYRCVKARDEKS